MRRCRFENLTLTGKDTFIDSKKHSIRCIIVLATLFFNQTGLSDDTARDGLPFQEPPGVNLKSPPGPVSVRPVVYVDTTKEGAPARLRLHDTDGGTLSVSKEKIDPQSIAELEKHYDLLSTQTTSDTISRLLQSGAIQPNPGQCPLPSSFAIVGDANGEAVGGMDFHYSNRPAGAQTQWMVFDFYTLNYRGSNSHMPVALRHEDIMHGWGGFIGQNGGSNQGCGANSLHNSQIQGWVQYTPFAGWDPETDQPPPGGPLWQSLAYVSSCGNELYDGAAWHPVTGLVPRYRMMLHASSGHWVGYQIEQWSHSAGWTTVTPWMAVDASQPETVNGIERNWDYPPPNFNSLAEGIFVGATDSSSAVPNWGVFLSNVQCGWF